MTKSTFEALLNEFEMPPRKYTFSIMHDDGDTLLDKMLSCPISKRRPVLCALVCIVLGALCLFMILKPSAEFTPPPSTYQKACDAINCGLQYVDYLQVVFWAGMDDVACYRIPTVVQTDSGTLLAFAEARHESCSDNNNLHDIVLRRSEDGGVTWGDLIYAVHANDPSCAGCKTTLSNPNPVEVRFEDGHYGILLHYNTYNKLTRSRHGVARQAWSFDEGRTWSNFSTISYPPVDNIGALIGPSVGIQSESGTIYFSARLPEEGTFLYYSIDFGRTWKSSEILKSDTYGLNECSISFLRGNATNERIIMSCRTEYHERATVEWSHDGQPLSVDYPGVTDPKCQGSLIQHDGALWLSNLKSVWTRSHLRLSRSIDDGATWKDVTIVYAGPAAYSQLVELETNDLQSTVGVIFEGGEASSYETISFARLRNNIL